jgi:hypothetical protein
MIAFGLRDKTDKRTRPGCRRRGTIQDGIEERSEKRHKKRGVTFIPLVRETVRARGFTKGKCRNNVRNFVRSERCRKGGKSKGRKVWERNRIQKRGARGGRGRGRVKRRKIRANMFPTEKRERKRGKGRITNTFKSGSFLTGSVTRKKVVRTSLSGFKPTNASPKDRLIGAIFHVCLKLLPKISLPLSESRASSRVRA